MRASSLVTCQHRDWSLSHTPLGAQEYSPRTPHHLQPQRYHFTTPTLSRFIKHLLHVVFLILAPEVVRCLLWFLDFCLHYLSVDTATAVLTFPFWDDRWGDYNQVRFITVIQLSPASQLWLNSSGCDRNCTNGVFGVCGVSPPPRMQPEVSLNAALSSPHSSIMPSLAWLCWTLISLGCWRFVDASPPCSQSGAKLQSLTLVCSFWKGTPISVFSSKVSAEWTKTPGDCHLSFAGVDFVRLA